MGWPPCMAPGCKAWPAGREMLLCGDCIRDPDKVHNEHKRVCDMLDARHEAAMASPMPSAALRVDLETCRRCGHARLVHDVQNGCRARTDVDGECDCHGFGPAKAADSSSREPPDSAPGRTTIADRLAAALAYIDEADEELEVELFTPKPDPNGPMTPDERGRLALWNAVEEIKAAQRMAALFTSDPKVKP